MKVFLGGTCNGSVWRDKLIPMLNIEYFNPVVEDWTEECMLEERKQREICDYCLYVITPSMSGVYSIAEVVDDSNKRPTITIFCVLDSEVPIITKVSNPMCYIGSPDINMFIDQINYPNAKVSFSIGEMKSLNQVGLMVERNGGRYFKSLEEVANYINKEYENLLNKLR